MRSAILLTGLIMIDVINPTYEWSDNNIASVAVFFIIFCLADLYELL